jgi:hypothetical protein
MIRIFKRIQRRSAIPEKKKYFAFALVEVFLISLSIFIAMQVNNWNENRKQDRVLQHIYAQIAEDMNRDLVDVGNFVTFYEGIEDTFQDVIHQKMTAEDFEKCGICPSLFVYVPSITLQKGGYHLLKNHVNISGHQTDTLALHIIQEYNSYTELFEILNKTLHEDILENYKSFRDNYDWFPDMVAQRPNLEILQYMVHNPEYRRKTAFQYSLVYQNYLPFLKDYLSFIETTLNALDAE